jgi:hypothetical protein
MIDHIDRTRAPAHVAPSVATTSTGVPPSGRSVKHRPADTLQLQSEVRSHARALMGVEDPKTPWTNVPSQHELEVFKKTGKGGPSIENFRPDLDGSPASTWNKRIIQLFAEDFVAAEHFSTRDKKVVEKLFQTHLSSLKSRYLKAICDDIEELQEYTDDQREDARVHRQRQVCCTVMIFHS